MGRVLAFTMIVLSVGACVGYVAVGALWRAVYWGAAALLTLSVTVM